MGKKNKKKKQPKGKKGPHDDDFEIPVGGKKIIEKYNTGNNDDHDDDHRDKGQKKGDKR